MAWAIPAVAQYADSEPTLEQLRTLQTIITSYGFTCPAAKIAQPRGPVPDGNMIRVYCGPADQSGIYDDLVYQVIFAPGGARPPIVQLGRGQ